MDTQSERPPGAPPPDLAADLLDQLRAHRAVADPFANPVLLLAGDVSTRLGEGTLDIAGLDALVQHLTVEGFLRRAERLGRYMGEADPAANDAVLTALFTRLARPEGAEAPVPFERFKAAVEREWFGIVFTAHPTFTLPGPLMEALTTLAVGRDAEGAPLSPAEAGRLRALAAATEHRPDHNLTLAREHALSMRAISNVQRAWRRAIGLLLQVAQQHYPEHWTALTPRLVTVASWVGYDLDGRSDIRWSDLLHKRLLVQAAQLAHYLAAVRALRPVLPADDVVGLQTLELMESRLALGASQMAEEIAVFGAGNLAEAAGQTALEAVSRRMFDGMAMRLVRADTLTEMLDRIVARTAEPAVLLPVLQLRAELRNFGLGMAHTHVRINATQVHNAIRRAVDLAGDPNDPRLRRSYLDRIGRLLDEARPIRINFGSLLAEHTSVKQLFMVVAQMLKYGDRTQPIRFLIAECESAFTVLAALYFARLFGCADLVDISPLFETEKALEAGSRVIDQLLEDSHYRDYAMRRGRVCIQTGYSDAGRYLGQTPAAASIERLRLRLTRVLAKHGLPGVELVVFDTHGESIGRGGHPAGFPQRLAYIHTPAVRRVEADLGVRTKQEVSFQGGDGYLPHGTPPAGYAALTRILEHVLTPPSAERDPFYDEADYVREFFTTAKAFQDGLMADPDYAVLLTGFGANLLYATGSRPSKRQHEEPGEPQAPRADQIRAIPHNATLQQLGLLANSVSGVGAAIARDPERFRSLYQQSARLRMLMGIVRYAASVSSPATMAAYIDTLDPRSWIARAGAERSRRRMDEMLRVADQLEPIRQHERQERVFRRLHRDFVMLADSLAEVAGPPADAVQARRDALDLLQAIRLALIHEIYVLATRIPEFSGRHGVTPRQLTARLIHLDVPAVVALLEQIFPIQQEPIDLGAFGEPADGQPEDGQNYLTEHAAIFQPMGQLYRIARKVTAAIGHQIGFHG